ncbi:MAG: hypothetical protein IKQ06_02915 [Bacilli bacterium]|nr:hypothetical protein [Bacilli bacterium]
MKKIIYIILLLVLAFIPFECLAKTCNPNDIKINSIIVKEKSENVLEVEPATINGMKLNLNINMYTINDYIIYSVNVKNNSSEDYYLDKNGIKSISDYLDYELVFEDKSNVIKANTSKILYITIKYKTKVPQNKFTNNKYNDYKSFIINFQNEEINNPKTLNNIYLSIVLLVVMIICTLLVIFIKNKKVKTLIIIICLLFIPITIYAFCKSEIKLETNVTLYNGKVSQFKFDCSDDVFEFFEGMTFGEWSKSNFYTGEIDGEYNTIDECIDIWGNNRGCALKHKKIYSIRKSYDTIAYSESEEECRISDNCTTLYNEIYKGEFAYEYDFYDSLEECEDVYYAAEKGCFAYNGKYVPIFDINYDYYTSLDRCNFMVSDKYYNKCTLLPTAYRFNPVDYFDYDTLEKCELWNSDNPEDCYEQTVDYYGPTIREKTLTGYWSVYKNGLTYIGLSNSSHYNGIIFEANSTIENKTYSCIEFGECVSPDSDILSGNGITIKAKDIKENDEIAYFDFDTNKTEIGKVNRIFIHKDASNLVKYIFDDKTYLDVTDYHPIYTTTGWKSYTNRNGYPKPNIGDLVKTNNGYKKIKKIIPFNGKEDYYDFVVRGKDGRTINNYFANGMLVQGSY